VRLILRRDEGAARLVDGDPMLTRKAAKRRRC
jgi:hypothetical protein